MENYFQWKLSGGQMRKILKKDVVPHKCLNLKKRKLAPDTEEDISPKVSRLDHEESLNLPSTSRSTETSEEKKYADSAVMAKPSCTNKGVQICPNMHSSYSSPFKIQSKSVSIGTSPIQLKRKEVFPKNVKPKKLVYSSDKSSTATEAADSTKTYVPLSTSSEDTEGSLDRDTASKMALKLTMRHIYITPKRYLGIAKHCMWILEKIETFTNLSRMNILLTLQKIRTGHTLAELSDAFGISESQVTRIFKSSVPLVATLLKELIVWPSSSSIRDQLPLAFRARYSKVESIIDCLEIEIMKPSDSVKQALTWSEYKKANTLKYLISSTPDGVINYISKGYGGRATDQCIVETCGYLDILKPGQMIMADRGFKNIDKLLCDRQCTLVRPPSVSGDAKLKKDEVLLTKRIASLRIHIERVIRRLREYKILKPHSCVHHKIVPLMDHIVYIVCGLVNLQEPLIKKK